MVSSATWKCFTSSSNFSIYLTSLWTSEITTKCEERGKVLLYCATLICNNWFTVVTKIYFICQRKYSKPEFTFDRVWKIFWLSNWLMFEREVAFCAVIVKRMFQINEILLYQWSSLNLPKRESGTGIFPLHFAKFLRTPFFTEHLQCMLLVCLELNLRQYWGLKKPTVKYFLMEIMWQFYIQLVFLF